MKKKGMGLWVAVFFILAIIGFAILLSFLMRSSVLQTGHSSICESSVAARSAGKGFINNLNCQTDYVCVSGGGTCENMQPTVNVNVKDPANNTQIMKAIADQMALCWWEFGEGKLDYVGTLNTGTYCGVCSIVGFSTKIQQAHYLLGSGQSCKKNSQCLGGNCDSNLHVCVGQASQQFNDSISYRELLDYLNSTNSTKGDTSKNYLYYLYGVSNLKNLLAQNPTLKTLYDSGFIRLNDSDMIVTGETRNAQLKVLAVNTNYLGVVFLSDKDFSRYIAPECTAFVTQF